MSNEQVFFISAVILVSAGMLSRSIAYLRISIEKKKLQTIKKEK